MQGAHLLMLSVCVLVAPAYAHAMTPPAGRAVVHVVRTAAPPLASLVSSSSASPPKQLRRPAAAATALSMEQQQQQQEQEQHEEQEQQPSSSRLDDFLSQFHGHFDNHAQTVANEAEGLYPREGGGHEHIHCMLTPVDIEDAAPPANRRHVLATYYFNGNPFAVFRERLYGFDALAEDPQFGPCVRMSIYRLRECTTARLRAATAAAAAAAAGGDAAASSRSSESEGEGGGSSSSSGSGSGSSGSGASSIDPAVFSAADLDASLRIPEADVFWRWCGERYEGEMRTPSIEIVSERDPSQTLRVTDDVAFWGDALWVNDRGCDATTGEYVYGNVRSVPYKMARVPASHWTVTGTAQPEAES